jgi:nicotinamide-nucleotide amidase
MTQSLLPADIIAHAAKVVDAYRQKGLTLTVAESCTGGLVSAAITEIPGASDVFFGGFVTYSNESKIRRLGVGSDVIETFGAVSIATAWAMARGALEASGADVAVAITGIAGPDGGTAAKPVGTVVFAKATRGCTPEEIQADQKQFDPSEGRSGVRRQATLCALELLMP